MTPLYNLQVHAVDGMTIWSVQSDSVVVVRKFLATYDHEGSTVVLCIDDLDQPNVIKSTNEQLQDEAVYQYLAVHHG